MVKRSPEDTQRGQTITQERKEVDLKGQEVGQEVGQEESQHTDLKGHGVGQETQDKGNQGVHPETIKKDQMVSRKDQEAQIEPQTLNLNQNM